MSPSDSETDPFDALMDIDADDFSQLLEEAPGEEASGRFSSKLRRGGISVVATDEISPETFQREYLSASRPCILVDKSNGAHTGHANLTSERLRDKYGDLVVPLDVTDRNKMVKVRLADFLDAVEEVHEEVIDGEVDEEGDETSESRFKKANPSDLSPSKISPSNLRTKYLRNLQISEWFPTEVLRLPQSLPSNLLSDEEKVPRCPKNWRTWFELFVSHPDCPGFPFLHRDSCSVHAAATQVSGVKRWVLFPPEEGEKGNLYPVGVSGSRSSIKKEFVRSLFEPAVPPETLTEYPLLGNVSGRVVCDVCPGETIIVPANWWHCAIAVKVDGVETETNIEDSKDANSENNKKPKCNQACVSVAASFVDASNMDQFNDQYCEFQAAQSLTKVCAGGIQ